MKERLLALIARKMVMFYFAITFVFLLTLWDKLSGDNCMLLFGWIVTNMIVGNVGEWKYSNNGVSTSITKGNSNG